MKQLLENHLSARFPFVIGKRLLLAVSGGLDSIVMATLFYELEYDIRIAHCNFNLRGEESDKDESFVTGWARDRNIEVYTTRFDTEKFASDNHLSIQVAARQLRYMWFEEICERENLDFVLTAHHADDSLETFIINLSRGTGIDGLTGIPEQSGHILRPMLIFSRDQILEYANQNHIKWREDSSNTSEKYLRNKIRNRIVPELKSLNPNLAEGFAATVSHLQQSKSLIEDASAFAFSKVGIVADKKTIFKIAELKELPNRNAYLYHWLKDFGFTAWNDIYDLISSQPGKKIFSKEFMLLKDREVLILSPLLDADDREYLVDKSGFNESPVEIIIVETGSIDNPDNDCIFVDAEKLRFPLTLRKWKESDTFHPFGMNGTKLVSKYFKDEKFSAIDKAAAWILCSEGQIVWIVNHRADDRFKVTPETNTIYKISTSS